MTASVENVDHRTGSCFQKLDKPGLGYGPQFLTLYLFRRFCAHYIFVPTMEFKQWLLQCPLCAMQIAS